MVVSPIEHSSVVAAAGALERHGTVVSWLPVDRFGRVSPGDVERALRPDTRLVSVGWANNEIGTIQEVAEIGRLCRERGVPLHSDAVQAFGKLPVDFAAVDLCSLSAHKIGGPGGIGALFIRRGQRVAPLLFGGRQERGVRPGSENVLGAVGFAAAAATLDAGRGPSAELRERLWRGICHLGGARRNSPAENCLENTLNVSLAGVSGEALVAALDLEGIAASLGSACSVGAGEPSHVLRALGRSPGEARDGVRFSLGPQTTSEEIDATLAALGRIVSRIRDVGVPRLAATA